jgi:protein translocase SecG subunit
MQYIGAILPYVQVTLSILLIAAILMQTRGSSVGGAFGGDNMGTTFYTRRGGEKMLFQATVILATLFVLAAFVTNFI